MKSASIPVGVGLHTSMTTSTPSSASGKALSGDEVDAVRPREFDHHEVASLQPGGDAGSGRAGRSNDSDSGRHNTCFRSLAEHEGNIQGKMQYPGKLRPNQRLVAGSRELGGYHAGQ